MVATLLAIALLGDIERAPDNRKAYDQILELIYSRALHDPLQKLAMAQREWKAAKGANSSKSPQGKATRNQHDLAKDAVRLTKLKWKDWPPPILELTFPAEATVGGEPPFGQITFGKLRSEVRVTFQTPGRGYYPERTKRLKTVKHKSRYAVLRVIDAHSMEVVEYYMGTVETYVRGQKTITHEWVTSSPVRIEGLPTAGAVEEISEINIGGKFFEDRGMLPRFPNGTTKIRVLRFLQ